MTVALDRVGARSGRWMEDPGFGVYVHIPFCVHRCHYCDFNTYEGLEALREPYVDAVIKEVGKWNGESRPVTSLFFGGGTPTILAPAQLGRILDAVDARFGLASDAEVTVEANPETVDEAKFSGLRACGFNRVSIGVQSLSDKVLEGLGRTHSSEVARDAIDAARRAGFDDLNADVIYGSPWERDGDWVATLEGIVTLAPDHVSAYALTIEEATPLATLIRTDRVPDVDPDVQADRYQIADDVLSAGGYERYEISNWSRPGRASRHNVLYWSAGDYVAAGAGGHGHVGGHRWWNVRLPRTYIESAGTPKVRAGEESLDRQQRGAEALMLGLRLRAGIPVEPFGRRFGHDVFADRSRAIDELVDLGLLERTEQTLRLTERATFLANEVVARLL